MSHPYVTLGLPETAADADVREAYVRLLRQYPPESAPDVFQQISDAYNAIKSEEDRATIRLFGQLYDRRPLAEIAPSFHVERQRAGIQAWLQAVKESSHDR